MKVKEKLLLAKEYTKIYAKNVGVKRAAAYTAVGATAVVAWPYMMAGAGLALGFWIGRKAAGEIKS